MFQRVKCLLVKEFIQALRDRKQRFFIIGPPLLQLLLFGYVVTLDVNHVTTALYDLDRSSESRELARRLEASGYFTIVRAPQSAGEIRQILDRGEAACAVQINPDFGKRLQRHLPVAVQVIVDGSDSNTGTIALNYITAIVASYSQSVIDGQVRLLEFRPRVWYNPDLKSRNYYIPGVIASIMLLTCLLLTSMAVVRERETGTIEQLMVSPLTPVELMLGKTVPFAVIAFFDMLLVTAVGVVWFRIPMHGSLLFLFFCTAVYLPSALGIGLFISTISRTQQQALMATMFFNMPAMILSGFTFPINNMPVFFQYLTYLNPLRYFIIIIRGIFLKGSGIALLWPELVVLAAMGVVIFTVSALRFHKRLG